MKKFVKAGGGRAGDGFRGKGAGPGEKGGSRQGGPEGRGSGPPRGSERWEIWGKPGMAEGETFFNPLTVGKRAGSVGEKGGKETGNFNLVGFKPKEEGGGFPLKTKKRGRLWGAGEGERVKFPPKKAGLAVTGVGFLKIWFKIGFPKMLRAKFFFKKSQTLK